MQIPESAGLPVEVASGISMGDRKPAFLTSSQRTHPDMSTELRTEITTPVFQNHRIKGSLIVSDQSQEFGSVIISFPVQRKPCE